MLIQLRLNLPLIYVNFCGQLLTSCLAACNYESEVTDLNPGPLSHRNWTKNFLQKILNYRFITLPVQACRSSFSEEAKSGLRIGVKLAKTVFWIQRAVCTLCSDKFWPFLGVVTPFVLSLQVIGQPEIWCRLLINLIEYKSTKIDWYFSKNAESVVLNKVRWCFGAKAWKRLLYSRFKS